VHRAGDIDYETVGTPFNKTIEVEVIEPDQNGVGGLVTRHPNMFVGYYKNEMATLADLHDGWMQTGDAGFFDDKGHLVVIDRMKDLAATASGNRFSPQYIENKLKFSPYVAEAIVLGDGQDFLAAIICIRFPIVSKWAEKRRIAFTTYADLSSKPEVTELLRTEVERLNASLPEFQRIAKFLLLYKELDADDGELTRTRKVRRGVIAEKYASIIDAIYSGEECIRIDAVIAFQDGTKQRIRTSLVVTDLLPTASHKSPRVAA
jgi:long-chain acyl-CoA synthetase